MSTQPRLVPLGGELLSAYRAYVVAYGARHVDDETSERAMADVTVGTDSVALLLDDAGRIVGAAALKPREGDPGRRWRILTADDVAHLPLLTAWVREQVADSYAYGFYTPGREDREITALRALGARQHKRTLGLARALPAEPPAEPSDIEVCELTPDRDEEFVALWRAAQHGRGEPVHTTPEGLRGHLDGPETNVCLAGFRGNALVATGFADVTDGAAWVAMLSVAEAERGRGLGRRMLRELAAWGTEQGATRIELCVDGHNENAGGLYFSEGYELDFEAVCLAVDGAGQPSYH